jgi:hypothetical protein
MLPWRRGRHGIFESMNVLAELLNLAPWQNFFVIVGSSAGALIGLQFVVIALIANSRKHADAAAIHAFGTPTVVHFGGALTVSAMMAAPWPSVGAAAIVVAVCGVGGLVYSMIVFARTRRQSSYKPVAEDWLWFSILPCGMYAALTFSVFILLAVGEAALFVVGGAALGLLLNGIRNAWDSVTHIVVEAAKDETDRK